MLCMKKELMPIEILLKFPLRRLYTEKFTQSLNHARQYKLWVTEAKKSSEFQNIAFCSFITNTKTLKIWASERAIDKIFSYMYEKSQANRNHLQGTNQKHMKKAGYFEFFRGDLKGRLPGVGILKKSCFILRPLTPRFQDGGVIHDDWLFSDKGRGGEIVNFFRSGNVKARLHSGNQLGKGE